MCCKKIKQILWPFNIFGKDKKAISYPLPRDPLPHSIPVEWIGERLRVSFVFTKHLLTPSPHNVNIPVVLDFTDGDGTTETINTWKNGFVITDDWTIHFNCTNVTSLIVNGETLI